MLLRRFRAGLPALVSAMLVMGAGNAVAQGAKERILREGQIVVGLSNIAPWGWKDETGALKGFDVDVIKAALSPLGLKKVDVEISTFAALIPGLQAGRFDASTGGLFVTPERCKLVAFSDTILRVADAGIVLAGNPKKIHGYADIAANKAVIFSTTRGNIAAKNADLAGVPKDRQLLFDDPQSAISALLAGRVDVVVATSGLVASLISTTTIKGIERAQPFATVKNEKGEEIYGNVAIAFRSDETGLRDLFNERIAELKKDGSIQKIMTQYGFSASETAANVSREQLCAPR